MDYTLFSKTAGFFGAVKTVLGKVFTNTAGKGVVGSMGKFVGNAAKTHALWSAIPAGIAFATAKGGIGSRAHAAVNDFAKNIVNPRTMVSNVFGYGHIPTGMNKLIGNSSKVFEKLHMNRMKKVTDYIGHDGLVPNLASATLIGEPVAASVAGEHTMNLYKSMTNRSLNPQPMRMKNHAALSDEQVQRIAAELNRLV